MNASVFSIATVDATSQVRSYVAARDYGQPVGELILRFSAERLWPMAKRIRSKHLSHETASSR